MDTALSDATTVEGRILIAWAAALFEAEGCITIHEYKGWRRIGLHLGMTDEDVVLKFAAIVGAGAVHEANRLAPSWKDHWKRKWQWQLANAKECERVLRLFFPHLGSRRSAKAQEALDLLEQYEADKHRVCYCGRPFRAERSTKRFCSRECAHAWKPTRKRLEAMA